MTLCRTMLITIKQKFDSQNPGTGGDSTALPKPWSPKELDGRIIPGKMPRVLCRLDHYSVFDRFGFFCGDSWTRLKKALNGHQETGVGTEVPFISPALSQAVSQHPQRLTDGTKQAEGAYRWGWEAVGLGRGRVRPSPAVALSSYVSSLHSLGTSTPSMLEALQMPSKPQKVFTAKRFWRF